MRYRLALIMFADIVGYTSMMAADEQVGIAAVKEINDKYLEPETNRVGGEILKRLGDGWILSFGSVHAGIQFATELLNALNGHPGIKIRIGAHIADIVLDDNDFYGAGINLAARLQSEAPPAGLMVSGDLFRQLTGDIAHQFKNAGNFDLKNIPYPVEGYQWRPTKRKGRGKFDPEGELPSIFVERFEFSPSTPEAEAHVQELRDQVLTTLARRTGVRTIDAADGTDAATFYTMRGRFRASGNRARMNTSIVLNETAETLFSRRYEADLSDMFEFADKITAQITSDLRVQINAFDAVRVKDLSDDELSVSELRSRAANVYYRATYDKWVHGVELLERALVLNPEDPMALGMRVMGNTILTSARFQDLNEDEVQSLTDDIDAAISNARNSDYLFACRAQFHAIIRRDAEAAIRDAKQSLSINPHYLLGYRALALGHMLVGDFDAAIDVLDQSVQLGTEDPLEASRLYPLALSLYCVGNFERCISVLGQITDKSPGSWGLHTLQRMAFHQMGNTAAAERCEAQANRLPKGPSILSTRPALPVEYQELVDALNPFKVPDRGSVNPTPLGGMG